MKFNRQEWQYFRYKLQERWERLGIQQWIEQHPKTIIGITVVSLFLCMTMAIAQLLPEKAPEPETQKRAWFYDLNTKELFVSKSSKLPPVKAPSGTLPDGTPAGVRAYVFASNEPNQTEPIIGFLEKFSEEGKEAQKAYDHEHHDVELWARGRFFRRPEDQEWMPADSMEAQMIYNEFFLGSKFREFPVQSDD